MIDGKKLTNLVKNNTDSQLNTYLLTVIPGDTTVSQWRIDYYEILRSLAYPPMADYLDGIVKGDQTQIDTYIDTCLAVKARFPKV